MKAVILLSVAAYIIACCLPALEWKNENKAPEQEIMLGLRALAVGWSGIFAGIVAWFANPIWLLALLLAFFRKAWLGSIAGTIALLIALTVFNVVGRELPGDEGNVTKTRIVAVLPGAYVWFASIGLSILAAILGGRK
jgi:hypothetical protein